MTVWFKSAERFQCEECMVTCLKLNKARAPPSNSLQELEEISQMSNKFTNFPGSPYGPIWMSLTDAVEDGVWRDYYTGQEAAKEVLETAVGGLKENTAQNCGFVS